MGLIFLEHVLPFSFAGFLMDPPGVDVRATGVVGVRNPFTRFCTEGVPIGV